MNMELKTENRNKQLPNAYHHQRRRLNLDLYRQRQVSILGFALDVILEYTPNLLHPGCLVRVDLEWTS